MKSDLLRTCVALFSTAWLVPLWIAVKCYLGYMEAEVWPRIVGTPHIVNSFPYLSTGATALNVAFVWLAVVILFWTLYALRSAERRAA
jgi:hypothetical protein